MSIMKLGISTIGLGAKIVALGFLAGAVIDVCTGGFSMGAGTISGLAIGGAIGGAIMLAGVGLCAYSIYDAYKQSANDQINHRPTERRRSQPAQRYTHSSRPRKVTGLSFGEDIRYANSTRLANQNNNGVSYQANPEGEFSTSYRKR